MCGANRTVEGHNDGDCGERRDGQRRVGEGCGGILREGRGEQRPAERCEAEQRKWWDPSGRVCATPILISDITGRVITDKPAEAAAGAATGRLVPPPSRKVTYLP